MTKDEHSSLFWAQKVNDETACGLFGPSLRSRGTVPSCETLVHRGLLRRVDSGTKGERGYWITEAGRVALSN